MPKNIVEYMNVPGLTRAHVASHLQVICCFQVLVTFSVCYVNHFCNDCIQKFRISLKKVAEKGLGGDSLNNVITLNRCFEPYAPYKGLGATNFGLSFGLGQSSLLRNAQANVSELMLKNVNPVQSDCINVFGEQQGNGIVANMLYSNDKSMSASLLSGGGPSHSMINGTYVNQNLSMNYNKSYVGPIEQGRASTCQTMAQLDVDMQNSELNVLLSQLINNNNATNSQASLHHHQVLQYSKFYRFFCWFDLIGNCFLM